MRCRSCNKELNDRESTQKDVDTGEFLDLCTSCGGYSKEYKLDSELWREYKSKGTVNYKKKFN